MLPIIAGTAAVLVAYLLVRASRQPDEFHVQRSARIPATPAQIFPHLNDFRRWRAWSPYETLDPAMQRTHSGSAQGAGAVYAWSSKGRAGVGRMEILGASPNESLRLKLDITRPVETHNIVDFTLVPDGTSTLVTWSMRGPNNLLGKIVQSVIDMDRMVGADFERGLARLATIATATRARHGAAVA